MKVELIKAELKDAELIHCMKLEAFGPLYERYHDDDTSPVKESIEKVTRQLSEDRTCYYLIHCESEIVGAVRVVRDGHTPDGLICRISPLFVLPAHQGRGIGYAALQAVFALHSEVCIWLLSTIKQEKGNCHLYEKSGFRISAPERIVNELMTLVFYQRNC